MAAFPEISTWLTIAERSSPDGRYQHCHGADSAVSRAATLPQLRAHVAAAHEDAKCRLRRLAAGSLDPLANGRGLDPSAGYPERLNIQTLKGYFGEVLAGMAAENLRPFGQDGWVVPAHLFRFHYVVFQQLEMINQTGEPAAVRPGRTGDDCLAFLLDDGRIVGAIFCEAKCTADHDAGLIRDAHEKSSLPNLIPVDLLQLIEVLEDSTNPAAQQWINALRRFHFEGAIAPYERFDQVTYVCGRRPAQSGRTTWIAADRPHANYTGGRKLHVAEIHLPDVDRLVADVYSGN
jgi:hypothetical protein